MNGHYFVHGRCFMCQQPISFDPTSVPSVKVGRQGLPVQGPADPVATTHPLCLECVRDLNNDRRKAGLPHRWNENPAAWQLVEGLPE